MAPSGPERPGTIASGTIFAGYRIEAEIGRGGMGVVYRVRHLALDRERALKVISPALSEDPHFRERFQREARLAASLEHPNVVPVDHAGDEGGVLYLSMRLVEGSDLRRIVEAEGPLDARRASQLLTGVAAGLDAAHERGLLHRDVKPANVLVEGVNGDERVFLTDFGISRIAGGGATVTASGELLGSPDYVSPEQVAGDRVDHRTDSTPSDVCSTSRSPRGRRSLATTTSRSSSLTGTPPAPGPPSWWLGCRGPSTGWWPGRWLSVPSRYESAGELAADVATIVHEAEPLAAGTRRASASRLRGSAHPSPAAGSWAARARDSCCLRRPRRRGRGGRAAPERQRGRRRHRPISNGAQLRPVATARSGASRPGSRRGPARLWVTSRGASQLYAIDPVTNQQAGSPVPAGGSPVSVAVAFDSIWALNRGSSTLLRLDPFRESPRSRSRSARIPPT